MYKISSDFKHLHYREIHKINLFIKAIEDAILHNDNISTVILNTIIMIAYVGYITKTNGYRGCYFVYLMLVYLKLHKVPPQ